MKAEWLSDARKIPDEVMNYLRPIAVQAVEEKHYSPELIADIFGISRSRIYDWLRWYHDAGEEALDTRVAPGAPPVITPVMDWWLKETVLNSTPVAQGYDTVLWPRAILAELLRKHFGICVSESTVGLHLHPLDLSCQTPCYRAVEQDRAQVAAFLEVKFPTMQRLAAKLGAGISPVRTRPAWGSGRGQAAPGERWDSHRRWRSPTDGAVITCCRLLPRTVTCVTRWKKSVLMENGMLSFSNRFCTVEPAL